MALLGTTEIQYAQCLWGPKEQVLTVDRTKNNNPLMRFESNSETEDLIITVFNDISVENMYSEKDKGAKKRIDIHIALEQIQGVLDILEPFVNSLDVSFDEAPRNSPDPTGTEHPKGLSLGKTDKITWVKGLVQASFSSEGYTVQTKSNGQIFIDAENYQRGARLHLGINNLSQTIDILDYESIFKLTIKYSQLKRFVQAIKVAKKWLS